MKGTIRLSAQYVRANIFYQKVPSKRSQCYVKMFGHLRDVCVTYELTLNIGDLHLDFEIAVYEAARQLDWLRP